MDWPTASIIIGIIIAITGLIFKFAKTGSRKCDNTECKKTITGLEEDMKTISNKVHLNNVDIQLLKTNHVSQEKIIDGIHNDVSKIFDKLDELKTIIISNLKR